MDRAQRRRARVAIARIREPPASGYPLRPCTVHDVHVAFDEHGLGVKIVDSAEHRALAAVERATARESSRRQERW